MGLPAIDHTRGEIGDAYIYARQLSKSSVMVKVRLGFGLHVVRVTSSMHDIYC